MDGRDARPPLFRALLNFDHRSSVGELLLDGFRFFLGNAPFNLFRGAVDQILGFFQAQAGDFTDSLDYIDLVRAPSASTKPSRSTENGRDPRSGA